MTNASEARGLTEGQIRSLAVEVVDVVHGYTVEFSNQPNCHEEEYDRVEDVLRRTLRVAAELGVQQQPKPDLVVCYRCAGTGWERLDVLGCARCGGYGWLMTPLIETVRVGDG